MTASGRRLRADAADALCSAAFARAVALQLGRPPEPPEPPEPAGVALVAVGGYGRRELAPYSDLDVVLVHTDGADVGVLASELWYPLWDAGAAVDHAVRALPAALTAAQNDVRVALGLIDARHLAGDPAVTLQLRTTLLAQWRRDARDRLPALRDLVDRRVERLGELAHASVPDVKESGGGLRDTTILKALVATWLVDVPHGRLEWSRQALLDVRDALHAVSGRASDRIVPEAWGDLAGEAGYDGPEHAQRVVREIGRRNTHLSRMTWRRVEEVLAPRPRTPRRTPGPALTPLGNGLAHTAGEVVPAQDAAATGDPTLLLRAAALAAERDLILSPHTVARLSTEAPALPEPWPADARDLLVRLLAAGPSLLPVWETLDETGALKRLLPEWDRLRLLPHASVVHRFTVDRHVVETCIEASRLIRHVARPDLLLVAALLHDIGKGGRQEHSVAGEPVAAALAHRFGFPPEDVLVIAAVVRWHLLLVEVATTRDLDDPATVEHVVARVSDPVTFEVLAALTEADARATSPRAWTAWRASLVAGLVARVTSHLRASAGPRPPGAGEGSLDIAVEVPAEVCRKSSAVDVHLGVEAHGSVVTVVTGDRPGVLAAVTGALALARTDIRSGRVWTQGIYAVSRWDVADTHLSAAVLRTQVEAVLAGRLDPERRLRGTPGRDGDPWVRICPEASRRSTVLEVRVEHRPWVVHLVCRALAGIGVEVRSAHLTTVGPQAVEVFYLQEQGAGALGDERSAEAAHAVRRALTHPATLGV